ncbi:MAG: hypothetical protein ACRBF0_14995 [Calditrichia bacterium]
MHQPEKNDIFETIEIENNRITNTILALYAGAFLTVVILFIGQIQDSYESRGDILLKESAIFIILVILSIQSIVFYFRLVIKLRENNFGKALSITLSAVLLILIVVDIKYGYYSVIGIGLGFIGWKAGQLYYFVKRNKVGDLTEKYLRKIYLAYILTTIVVLSFGLYMDFSEKNLIPFASATQEFNYLSGKIELLEIPDTDKQILLKQLKSVKSKIEYRDLALTVVYGATLFLIVFLIIYALYKAFLVKTITLPNVHDELRLYYSN